MPVSRSGGPPLGLLLPAGPWSAGQQQPPSNRGMTPVGLACACHEVDMQGSSWETFGKGRQAWSVAWLPPR